MDSDSFVYKLKTVLTYMDLSDRLKTVGGFLLEIQGFTLMTLANEGPGAGAIVEIGSFMGRSTCCLAIGSKSARREKVYAVDPFTGSPEHQAGGTCEIREIVEEGTTWNVFLNNIREFGVEDYVVPIKAASTDAARDWSGPIRLLFIDGDHSYEASRLDFDSWSPFVVEGGIIAFHDIGHWEGVTNFYNDLMRTRGHEFREILGLTGLHIVERIAPHRAT